VSSGVEAACGRLRRASILKVIETMKRLLGVLVVASGISLAAGGVDNALAGAPISEALAPLHTLAPMLRAITPGVVGISARGRVREENPLLRDPLIRRFFNSNEVPVEREMQAVGSGVIVDAAHGYILTNSHVVQHATSIKVTTKDNRQFQARLIGRDPQTDVAVLRIAAGDLTAVPLGNSDDLEVGDFVLAIGNPFGLGQTVTSGIVSALGRSGLGIEGYEDFIQTDASINPGNSGGALVDLRGRLVGVNTAILAPGGGNIGIGFAVPINMARAVMDQLIRYGRVRRGRIGVVIEDLTPELAESLGTRRTRGAVVERVEPGSPAAAAGLRRHDLIVAVNGSPVASGTDLHNRIGLARIGKQVALTVDRGGDERTIAVRIQAAGPAQEETEER
jgi:Do/DeqQ family serine protease